MKNPVPRSSAEVLSNSWLEFAVSRRYPDAKVARFELIDAPQSMAVKYRLKLAYASPTAAPTNICVKGFFDSDDDQKSFAWLSLEEAEFYLRLAPQLPQIRKPDCLYSALDRQANLGVMVMNDLIVEGARFLSPLELIDADLVAASLEQLASLHAAYSAPHAIQSLSWVPDRLVHMAAHLPCTARQLQELMDGPRGAGFNEHTRRAENILAALQGLVDMSREWPKVLLHGDGHAGNFYRTSEGPGLADWALFQRGGWALDVAYHINTMLTVNDAERHERRLLTHYLELLRSKGVDTPAPDEAFRQYRLGLLYGYFMWAVTRRVDPRVTDAFVQRLGFAAERNHSLALAISGYK